MRQSLFDVADAKKVAIFVELWYNNNVCEFFTVLLWEGSEQKEENR